MLKIDVPVTTTYCSNPTLGVPPLLTEDYCIKPPTSDDWCSFKGPNKLMAKVEDLVTVKVELEDEADSPNSWYIPGSDTAGFHHASMAVKKEQGMLTNEQTGDEGIAIRQNGGNVVTGEMEPVGDITVMQEDDLEDSTGLDGDGPLLTVKIEIKDDTYDNVEDDNNKITTGANIAGCEFEDDELPETVPPIFDAISSVLEIEPHPRPTVENVLDAMEAEPLLTDEDDLPDEDILPTTEVQPEVDVLNVGRRAGPTPTPVDIVVKSTATQTEGVYATHETILAMQQQLNLVLQYITKLDERMDRQERMPVNPPQTPPVQPTQLKAVTPRYGYLDGESGTVKSRIGAAPSKQYVQFPRVEYDRMFFRTKSATSFVRQLLPYYFSQEELRQSNFDGGVVVCSGGRVEKTPLDREKIGALFRQVEVEFVGATATKDAQRKLREAINDKCRHT